LTGRGRSLASRLPLIAFSAAPAKVRDTLLKQGWFEADEIEL
jgi:hypothetical protein